jgi:transcriptional regulator with XRE-family HTH domain
MPKATVATMQETLQDLLVSLRTEAGLRQVDLAERLGKPQSFVSKYESGERRLDFVELHSVCKALHVSLVTLAERFERALRQ